VSEIAGAFPAALRPDASVVSVAMPPAHLPPSSSFDVVVDGEAVTIPYRLYNPEPSSVRMGSLSPVQLTMLACLYTRHHDGRVRQRYLRLLAAQANPWVAPFVVQLLGEYVVEIVLDTREYLAQAGEPLRAVYRRFAADNPQFLNLTRQRATSYWDCYYRSRFPDREDYPAFRILRALEEGPR
jgi:hypothetical protein